jgi:hypothetical protein
LESANIEDVIKLLKGDNILVGNDKMLQKDEYAPKMVNEDYLRMKALKERTDGLLKI